eukprot:jgi/Botrbrau1/7545/Bobra.0019s0030.1
MEPNWAKEVSPPGGWAKGRKARRVRVNSACQTTCFTRFSIRCSTFAVQFSVEKYISSTISS